MELKYRTAPAELDGETEGRLKAAFSVFDEIDSDGDIVRASAFTDGQAVPMVWAHDWKQPIGKGVVRVEQGRAVFDGEFNLKTTAGRDAYEAVKFAGDLQQYSYGFKVLASEKGSHEGKTARVITKTQLFEVSPVLVGANQSTHTIGIKGNERFDEQDGRLRADLEEYLVRCQSLADLRAKEGRAISTARRERITAMLAALREHADELDALLRETAPPEREPESEKGQDVAALLAAFLAIDARLAGVEV